MSAYAALVMLLCFLVELLLLFGAGRLCKRKMLWWRVVLGAGVSGLYAGLCLLQRFQFLGGSEWRIATLVLTALIAYGASWKCLRTTLVFLLLNVAVEGASSGFTPACIWLVLGILLLLLLRQFGFYDGDSGRCLPVEICHGGKCVHVTALVDTGNTLKDPMTGEPVLIIGADAAYLLTGLTRQQLRTPAESILHVRLPGLRLIPYHTVGQGGSFLLAMRIRSIKINGNVRSGVVAFAPEGLGEQEKYQALTGGAL